MFYSLLPEFLMVDKIYEQSSGYNEMPARRIESQHYFPSTSSSFSPSS